MFLWERWNQNKQPPEINSTWWLSSVLELPQIHIGAPQNFWNTLATFRCKCSIVPHFSCWDCTQQWMCRQSQSHDDQSFRTSTTFGGFKIHEIACSHHNTGTTMWNCKNDANGIRTRPQTPPLLPLLSANHQPTPVLWLWFLVICILISTTKFPRHTIATNFLHELQR